MTTDSEAPPAPIAQDELDELLARDLGPYLRIYVALRLRERGEEPKLDAVLADLFAGLLSANAFVHSGDRAGFQSRLYGLVDAVLPHLGRDALRRPPDPEHQARGRLFVERVAEAWHSGYAEVLDRLGSLPLRERDAVLWRDHHALSMAEIGQRLGLDRESARAYVDGIRTRLRVS